MLLFSGRLTWDLMVERTKSERDDVAIVRVERLYPWPIEEIKAELDKYPDAKPSSGSRTSRSTRVRGRRTHSTWCRSSTVRRADHPQGVVDDAVGTAKRHPEEEKILVAARSTRCTSPTAGSRSSRSRRGDEEVTLAWLAERLQEFTDVHPEFETAVERFATWLARLDDPDD